MGVGPGSVQVSRTRQTSSLQVRIDIRLTAANAVGNNTATRTGYIIVAAPVPPVATFNSDIQTGTAPLVVRFTDKSTGTAPLTYAWDFNDDTTIDSSVKSPSFTYTTPGTYSVKLTVTNIAGTNSTTRTDYIIVSAPVPPGAAFNSDIQTGTAPLVVRFTDKSTGTAPLTYAWDFNDDTTIDSSVKSPSFTYTTPGTYSVKLTVTNIAGTNSTTRTDYVIVSLQWLLEQHSPPMSRQVRSLFLSGLLTHQRERVH